MLQNTRNLFKTTRIQKRNAGYAVPRTTRFLSGKHVLSTEQFTRDNLEEMCNIAAFMQKSVETQGVLNLCSDKYSANLFYEPSTRTMGSFHTAMGRLGGQTLPIYTEFSSVKKGETLEDTIRVIQNFVDVIIMRHPEIGSVAQAASVSSVPVINAGDGANEHPTQALLDLYCMYAERGSIDGLTIAMVGDLKYGRTVHSLSKLLSHYNVKLKFVSPLELKMPSEITSQLAKKNTKFEECIDLSKEMHTCDVVYMTRVQKERFPILEDYNKVKDMFIMDEKMMSFGKSNMMLMHPLPRINEITVDVDNDPRSKYFLQPKYGMFMRMAILAAVLGKI